jgi:hypothetical protein
VVGELEVAPQLAVRHAPVLGQFGHEAGDFIGGEGRNAALAGLAFAFGKVAEGFGHGVYM